MQRRITIALFLSLLASCRSTQKQPTSETESKMTSNSLELKNYSGSVVCPYSKIYTVRTVEEIQAVVKDARANKKNVRVISIDAPRSYSPVICPEKDGIFLNVKPLNKLLSVDKEAQTATIQPGMTIDDLTLFLDDQGFTFPVTPDYNGITVVGGMGTGAHHSSLRFATDIGSWVEELKLVDGQGEIQTLSGAALDTARVHLGLLGVIFELKVRILPQYKLKYGFEKHSDDSLERDFEALVRAHDYARIMWFPHQKKFVIDHHDKVPLSTPGESENNTWTTTPNLSWLGDIPVGTLNSSQIVQCTAEVARFLTFAPAIKPVKSDFFSPVGRSHKMIAGNCPEGKCTWDNGIKTRTVEVGIALDRAAEWMKDVKALVREKKACFPILGIYLRFSAASKSALGEAAGRDTVVFEIHVPQTSKPSLEPSSDVYDEIVQLTLAKYNGRPHWGKNSLPYFLGLGVAQYPDWEKFTTLRHQLDPDDVFKSPFWSQIEARQRVASSEGCAVSKQCICSIDSDCGDKGVCSEGTLFKEARVCRRK